MGIKKGAKEVLKHFNRLIGDGHFLFTWDFYTLLGYDHEA